MKPAKTFAWSAIPNLVIRGPKKLITVRIEKGGGEFFAALGIEADPEGRNADFARAARAEFVRRLAWAFLWVDQNAHRFPGRDRIALVRAALADPGIQAGAEPAAALEKFGAEELRRSSRLGALLTAWDGFARAQVAAGRMGAAHARRARTSLLLILSRSGVPTAADTPLDVLTGDLLVIFERATFAALAGAGPLARNRARNSIASTVRQARALLSDEARESPEYRAIVWPPGVAEFRRRKVEAGEIVPEALPSAVVMDRIRRARGLMRRLAPRHWAALVLAHDLGLRAGEVAAARWDWAREVETAGGARTWEFAIVLGEDYGPKGHSRRLILDPGQVEAWAEVRRGRSDAAPEILGGETPGERIAIVERVGRWLRAVGFAPDKKTKPLHKLRKLRASRVSERDGLEAARGEMGHGDARTTLTHYQLAPRAVG
jgi:integrase